MIELATLIVSIIKMIPLIEKIFSKTVEIYYYQLDLADQNKTQRISKKRDALLASLKLQGLSDEQKNNIRRLLYDLSRE